MTLFCVFSIAPDDFANWYISADKHRRSSLLRRWRKFGLLVVPDPHGWGRQCRSAMQRSLPKVQVDSALGKFIDLPQCSGVDAALLDLDDWESEFDACDPGFATADCSAVLRDALARATHVEIVDRFALSGRSASRLGPLRALLPAHAKITLHTSFHAPPAGGGREPPSLPVSPADARELVRDSGVEVYPYAEERFRTHCHDRYLRIRHPNKGPSWEVTLGRGLESLGPQRHHTTINRLHHGTFDHMLRELGPPG